MKSVRVSRRERLFLMVGVAIVAPILVTRLAVRPYLTYASGLEARIVQDRELLARERGLIEGLGELPVILSTVEARLEEIRPALLRGDNDVATEGALSAYVAARARESGVLLQRSEGTLVDNRGEVALSPTTIVVQTLGDLEGVLRFLYALDTGPLMVTVEQIQLQPSPLRTSDPEEAQPLAMGARLTAYSVYASEPVDTGSMRRP